jgi:uncharacterized repeat protein (TIGR03803 family)
MTHKTFSLYLSGFLTALGFVLVCSGSAYASSSKEEVLFRFNGTTDGYNPQGTLIADNAGNLYGTTEYGGGSFYGTIFELSPPSVEGGAWTHTVLYTFNNHGDGARPTDGLIFDGKGNLYGTTGDSAAGGFGEIFELSPPAVPGNPWTETVLYSFQGKHDGAYPRGGLLFDEKGNLYGTSAYTVFKLRPPTQSGGAWTFVRLHIFFSFTSDGFSSQAGLVRDQHGNLFGTTLWGGFPNNPNCGSLGCGTVFELSPPASGGGGWAEQVIHTFGESSTDGFDPEAGLALDADGNLYGTTYSGGSLGGGMTFELSPSAGGWIETDLHDFSYSNGDGAAPAAAPVLDGAGNLYGTTLFGGKGCFFNTVSYGCGVVYKLSPPRAGSTGWSETVLDFFSRGVGAPHQSAASLLLGKNGQIYGTTVYGGTYACFEGNGCGTAFRLKP